MGLLDFIFGDNESKYDDLWERLKDMPTEQLVNIVQLKPNSPHGRLACVALFLSSPHSLRKILDADRDDSGSRLVHSLKSLERSDVILLGRATGFQEIRNGLKRMAPLFEEYGA